MNKNEITKWREDYTVWDSPCLGAGLRLHCHFDEKDDVKLLGARWEPTPNGGKGGHWWMPKDVLDTTINPVDDHPHDETILEFLNRRKMIAGQHGRLSAPQCLEYADADHTFVAHRLIGTSGDDLLITVYADAGIVRFLGNAAHGSDQWLPTMEARETWEMLMTSGYRKIVTKEKVSS